MSGYFSYGRKLVLFVLLVLGFGLLAGGVALERATLAVAGAGCWLLVLMAFSWGMRFRLDHANQAATALQGDLKRLRRSQLSMHARVSTRLRTQKARLDRIRESQLKLHSRIALQGVSATRQHNATLDELRSLLERSRQAGTDAQELTLRAYREAHTEWTRVHALLDAHGTQAEQLEQGLGRLLAAQQELAGLHAEMEALSKQWKEGRTKLLTRSDQNRREVLQATEAILQLEALSLLRAPHSLMDGWAMDPVSVLSVIRLVLESRPRLVVECGSGTSTAWIAAALKQNGEGRLVSLEHLDEYGAKTRAALASQGLEGVAEVRIAPLVAVPVEGSEMQWYDPALLADLGEIDMLLVDGPPKSVGPEARYPAIPVLAQKLRSGALIIVDDCDRAGEVATIKRWRDRMPDVGPTAVLGPRTLAMRWQYPAGS